MAEIHVSRLKARIHLWTTICMVAFGTSFQIYNTSVVNNVQFLLQDWVNITIAKSYSPAGVSRLGLDALWSFAASCVMLGAMGGSLLTRQMAERLGRRGGLMANCALNITGLLMVAFADELRSFEMFVTGRIVTGVSLGAGLGLASMFLTEIAPISQRGRAGTAQQLFIGLGDFLSLLLTLPQFLGTAELWPLVFAFPIIPSLLQLLFLFLVCPESPRFLYVTQNEKDKGRLAAQWFQGDENLEELSKELEAEAKAHELPLHGSLLQPVAGSSFMDLLTKRQYRKPLVICCVAIAAVMLSGISVVFAYSTNIFTAAGLSIADARMATVALGFLNFVVPSMTIYLVERYGRRLLMLSMIGGCMCALVVLSFSTWFSDEHNWVRFLSIPSLILFQISYTIGSPISSILPCELFETHIRSAATAVTGFQLWTLSTISVLLYLPVKALVGISISFVPFTICLIACFIYLWINMPETRGKPVQEIVAEFHKTILPADMPALLDPVDSTYTRLYS